MSQEKPIMPASRYWLTNLLPASWPPGVKNLRHCCKYTCKYTSKYTSKYTHQTNECELRLKRERPSWSIALKCNAVNALSTKEPPVHTTTAHQGHLSKCCRYSKIFLQINSPDPWIMAEKGEPQLKCSHVQCCACFEHKGAPSAHQGHLSECYCIVLLCDTKWPLTPYSVREVLLPQISIISIQDSTELSNCLLCDQAPET